LKEGGDGGGKVGRWISIDGDDNTYESRLEFQGYQEADGNDELR
jgi:hypothetical protein